MIVIFYILTILMGFMCLIAKVTINIPILQFIGKVLFKLGGLYVMFYSTIQLSKQLGWL